MDSSGDAILQNDMGGAACHWTYIRVGAIAFLDQHKLCPVHPNDTGLILADLLIEEGNKLLCAVGEIEFGRNLLTGCIRQAVCKLRIV